jgi:hypothetical protein
MSKSDVGGSADDGTEHTQDRGNQKRQEDLKRFGRYTAPTMLAMLMSSKQAPAQVNESPACFRCSPET